MSGGKVLIAAPVHAVLTEGLQHAGYELLTDERITQEKALALLPDCVGVITSTRLQLDRQALDRAPQLQWIGRMGSGMEVIDTVYAAARGIACFGSPEGNCNAVAEHALGMLLSLTKRITWSMREVGEGLWKREENRGTELEGKTIGIIGFGHTGRAFAKKLQGFDMRILAYDIQPQEDIPPYVTFCRDLEPIFQHANIISFHVPLREDTRNYFNQNFLDRMTQDFILINTSRGEIGVTEVIKNGLHGGKIRGGGFDVWPGEPLEKMNEEQRSDLEAILQLPGVIVTPHIAGYSEEALYKMSFTLLKKVINYKTK